MKKSLIKASAAILAGALTMGAMSLATLADSGINVKVNGKSVSFTDAKPFIDKSSRTLVPLRAIGEALGLEVVWDNDIRTATFFTVSEEGVYIEASFPVDKNFYHVMRNNEYAICRMDTTAIISQSRTYAPARYLAEAFGYTVGWDAATKTVLISNSAQEPTPAPSDNNAGNKAEDSMFAQFTAPFYFSSGAGGWGTELYINPDGSFQGNYYDYEFGLASLSFPNGVLYTAKCSGQFSNPVKINDYTYSMTLTGIEYERAIDTEEIIDGTRYIYSTAYGIDGAKTFYIYTPDAPVSQLPEEFLCWDLELVSGTEKETLGYYGIYNVNEGCGFTSSNGAN